MFLAGMREKSMGRVVIEDVSAEAIHHMLEFAYKDDCPDLDEQTLSDVLRLSSKYDMPGLRDTCLEFMAKTVRSDNVVNFLSACERYGLREFKNELLNALVDNPSALHECIHGHCLDDFPELMKDLLSLCCHKLNRSTKDTQRHGWEDDVCDEQKTYWGRRRHKPKAFYAKHFDGLPYRSNCYLCTQEVVSMPKQTLGEMLFPMVQKICAGQSANKITGMIIELDNHELIPLFESESALNEKVEEALSVLRAAEEPLTGDEATPWLRTEPEVATHSTVVESGEDTTSNAGAVSESGLSM
jgi:hypothetical protein